MMPLPSLSTDLKASVASQIADPTPLSSAMAMLRDLYADIEWYFSAYHSSAAGHALTELKSEIRRLEHGCIESESS